ncbi:MAG: enoyl-CoA hydratase/isomerase family protein [Rhodobacteraceae bacterium]|nr:enoyl-CoA hydratase/isomerase family protein [Paracoccaceae bacterium]
MGDIDIRIVGHAGRITLTRPKALNALTYEMCRQIEAALVAWRDDPAVALVVIDGQGERAFCAGGDIQEMYDTGTVGDLAYGRQFWRDEYRLNARVAEYPKPYMALMQGFTMGGGVGVSCHGSHRIVGESSQIAMPECGIGLVPDVGGSYLLARAPGRLGDYLGLSSDRMGPEDAIYAGFADTYIPQAKWPEVIAALENSGDAGVITKYATTPPAGHLTGHQAEIDAAFAGATLAEVVASLQASASPFAATALKAVARNSPLSMAVTIEILRQLREDLNLRHALHLEYRYTYNAMEKGDFLEGIRAAIIDKDRAPKWKHRLDGVSAADVAAILAPLGQHGLDLEGQLA